MCVLCGRELLSWLPLSVAVWRLPDEAVRGSIARCVDYGAKDEEVTKNFNTGDAMKCIEAFKKGGTSAAKPPNVKDGAWDKIRDV